MPAITGSSQSAAHSPLDASPTHIMPPHTMSFRWVMKRAAFGFMLLFFVMGGMAWLIHSSLDGIEEASAADTATGSRQTVAGGH